MSVVKSFAESCKLLTVFFIEVRELCKRETCRVWGLNLIRCLTFNYIPSHKMQIPTQVVVNHKAAVDAKSALEIE